MSPTPALREILPWQGTLGRTGWLWRYFLAQWRLFGGGALCLALTHACALTIPWVLKDAISELHAKASADLGRHILMMLAAALGAAVVRTASRTLIYAAGREIEHDLRNDLVEHLLRLPLPMVKSGRVGDFLSRAQTDCSEVRTLAGPGFLNVANTVMAYVSTTLAMWSLDPALTLCGLAPYPVLFFVFQRMSSRMGSLNKQLQAQLGDLSARLSESLAGAMVVKCHGLEGRELAELERRSRAYLERQLEFTLLRSSLWPLVFLISGLGIVIVLWVGGGHVRTGSLPLGSLVAFTSYYAYLLWPTIGLGWIMSAIQRGFAASDRLHEMWVVTPEPTTAAGVERPVTRGVQVRDLAFAHVPGRPVLDGLSLDLEAGAHVALMGRTGSGKSTLLALIARVLPLPPGTVLVDGTDLASLPLVDVRRSLVLVPQEPYLFSQTVLENLRWALPGADERSAREAARVAGLAGDIERLPGGYDARVGEAGVTLSRGQRQRMALARALLVDPPVLLLDDPFSAVDTHTEEEILRRLAERRRGKLTVVVTHRVSTAALADRIFMLDGGRIAEEGTAAELLARRGLYHQLAVAQTEEPV